MVGASDFTIAKVIRRTEYAQLAGGRGNGLAGVLLTIFQKANFSAFSQYWRRARHFDHAYNNSATSGVDMGPELLVRMFQTIDNVSMVKESTGELSRMQRIDELSDGSTTPAIRWCWTPCGQARRVFIPSRASTSKMPRTQAKCPRRKLTQAVAGVHRRRGLAATVKAGLEQVGAGVGDRRRPLLPLDGEGRTAWQKLLADA